MPSAAWQGSTGRGRTRTPEWRKLRLAILNRDGHTCTNCGAPGNHVDHQVPHAEGGTDHPDNLRTLCRPCHDTKTQTEAVRGRARLDAKAKRPTEPHPGLR